MYQFISYLKYLLSAGHRKGHGIHSPFVYDFYTSVIKPGAPENSLIENLRKEAGASDELLEVIDHGAGTHKNLSDRRPLRKIMKQTAVRKRYGSILGRMVSFVRPEMIIELGTGLGISTMYMAKAAGETRIISLEGCQEIAGKAAEYFNRTGCQQIEVITGRFSDSLPGLLEGIDHPLMVFIDGDHRESSVLDNISVFLPVVNEDSVIIMDDIHLSEEMNNAWQKIIDMPQVTLSIDLFRMGILFFRTGMYKQHYSMRLS